MSVNGHTSSVATDLSPEFVIALAKGLAPFLAPYVKEFVAETAKTYLSDEVIAALAKGVAPYVRETVAPLTARLDETENCVRNLVRAAADRHD